MPITKSAKKALRQSERKRGENTRLKSRVRDIIKRVRKLAEEKQTKEALALLPQAYKAIDKAAKKFAISPSSAPRVKSRLARTAQKSS
ncbi:MAG: 30S ribosomal protein S20 [bacterium]|nr:30S ribosomal protein S20 [bacterium]